MVECCFLLPPHSLLSSLFAFCTYTGKLHGHLGDKKDIHIYESIELAPKMIVESRTAAQDLLARGLQGHAWHVTKS